MKNLLIVALMSVFLVACGGGGASVQSTSITQGQELVDLKKALDEGIINQKEYDNAKEAILEKYE